MKQLIYLIETMRPKQWTKNIIIFAALVFDNKLLQLSAGDTEAFARRVSNGDMIMTLVVEVLLCLVLLALSVTIHGSAALAAAKDACSREKVCPGGSGWLQ